MPLPRPTLKDHNPLLLLSDGGYRAADLYTSPPDVVEDLATRETSFTVTQEEFDGYEGQWYLVDANASNHAKYLAGAVFNVKAPKLNVTIRDINQNDGADVSGTSILKGVKLQFQIGTNLYTVLADPELRTPVWNNAGSGINSDGYLDIRVKDESGADFPEIVWRHLRCVRFSRWTERYNPALYVGSERLWEGDWSGFGSLCLEHSRENHYR